MKILMLGNSFTTANRMPDMLAELTGAEDCALKTVPQNLEK